MELADVVEALAHLSSEIDQLRAKQSDYHVQSWERLEQWSKTNENLTICLREQSQANRESTGIYQALVQHLLTLAQTTQQLTAHTSTLEGSSKKLTKYLVEEQALQLQSLEANNQQLQISSSQLAQYLIEEQAPQLESLEANSKQLQASSSNLETYLKTEQSERLKMLESSLRTLLEMIEVKQGKNLSSQTVISSVKTMDLPVKSNLQSVPTDNSMKSEALLSPRKKWSFDAETVLTSALVSLLSTAFMLILLKAGGLSTAPTSPVEASEQSATTESVESASND